MADDDIRFPNGGIVRLTGEGSDDPMRGTGSIPDDETVIVYDWRCEAHRTSGRSLIGYACPLCRIERDSGGAVNCGPATTLAPLTPELRGTMIALAREEFPLPDDAEPKP